MQAFPDTWVGLAFVTENVLRTDISMFDVCHINHPFQNTIPSAGLV